MNPLHIKFRWTAAFALAPGVSLYVSPLREEFLFPIKLCGLGCKPCWISKPDIWGLVPHVLVPRVGVPLWGKNPSFLRKKLHICEIRPNVGYCTMVRDFSGTMYLLLLPILMWPFHPLLWGCSASFRSLSEVIIPYLAAGSACLCKEVSSRSSYATILNHLIVIVFLGEKWCLLTQIVAVFVWFAHNFYLLDFCLISWNELYFWVKCQPLNEFNFLLTTQLE